MRATLIAAAFALVCATEAQAQLVVFDPSNVSHVIKIAKQSYDLYMKHKEEAARWEEQSQRMANPGRYTMKAPALATHDTARYAYGSALLTGLNVGDARGDLYHQTVRALPAYADIASAKVPTGARAELERAFAGLEIMDSIQQRSINNVGAHRAFFPELERAVQELENDVTSDRTAHHYFGANADKLAASGLIGARQNMAMNQSLSGILESLLVEGKEARDADVERMNLRLTTLRHGMKANAAIVEGSGQALQTWRRP